MYWKSNEEFESDHISKKKQIESETARLVVSTEIFF